MLVAVRAVATAILVAGPTALAFFSGGFFAQPQLVAGIVAWILAATAAVTAPRPLPRSAPGRLALVGLAALCAWTAASLIWAPLGGRATQDLQRMLLYLGFLVAAIALLRGHRTRRWLEPAVALGALAVILFGLSERLLPGLVTLDRSFSAQGRLEQPLTYWNATGALAALGVVLCARIAADARSPRSVRIVAAMAGAPLGLGVYLSFSRGALVALVAGFAVLLILSHRPRAQLRAAATVLGAGVVAAAVSSALSAVESLPPGAPGRPGQGAVMLAVLVAAGAAAGWATAWAPTDAAARGSARLAGVRRPLAATGLIALLAAGVAAVAVLGGSPAPRSSGDATDAARFGSADTVRYAYWEVAVAAFGDDPLLGTGAGGFAVEWRKTADRPEDAVDAHSVYVETLAELGLPGAALFLLFLGATATAGARLYGREPAAAVGPAAALMTWAVHAGVDWDWEMPALTGIALLLAGGLVAWEDGER